MVDAPFTSKTTPKTTVLKMSVRGQQTFMEDGLIFLPEATAILTFFPVKSPKCFRL